MAQVAAAQLVALGLRERAVPLGGDDVAGLDQSSPDNSSACPGQLTPLTPYIFALFGVGEADPDAVSRRPEHLTMQEQPSHDVFFRCAPLFARPLCCSGVRSPRALHREERAGESRRYARSSKLHVVRPLDLWRLHGGRRSVVSTKIPAALTHIIGGDVLQRRA